MILIDSKLQEWKNTGLIDVVYFPLKKEPKLRVTLKWLVDNSYIEHKEYEEKKYLFGVIKVKKLTREWKERLPEEEINEKEKTFLEAVYKDLKF